MGYGFVNGAHCGSREPRLHEPAPALPQGGRLVTHHSQFLDKAILIEQYFPLAIIPDFS